MPDSEDSAKGYDPLDSARDCFHPPSIPTLVHCLHCGEEYDSYLIDWRIETDRDGKKHGFWCCPTEDCDGIGFGFDIHPVDDDWMDPDGRDMGHWSEDPPPDPDTDWYRPPEAPTPVRCERCGQEYASDEMVWYVEEDEEGEPYDGWWTCPTEGCEGEGFGIDVRPTDPDYVDALDRQILRPGEKPPPPPPLPPGSDDDIPY